MAEIRMITFSPNLLLSSEAPCSLNLWINSTFNWILWNWIKSHFGIMISVFPNESSFKGSHLYSVLKKSSLRILEVYKDSASKFSHPSYFLSFHLLIRFLFFSFWFYWSRKFPGSPVVKTLYFHSLPKSQVQSLVRS